MLIFERCFVLGDRQQLLLRTALHSSQRWLLEVLQREPLVAKGWVWSRFIIWTSFILTGHITLHKHIPQVLLTTRNAVFMLANHRAITPLMRSVTFYHYPLPTHRALTLQLRCTFLILLRVKEWLRNRASNSSTNTMVLHEGKQRTHTQTSI